MRFLAILHRSGPLQPKNGVRRNIDLFSMRLVVLLVLIKENVVFWMWVSSFPFVPKKCGLKLRFLAILHRSGPLQPKNGVRRNSDLFSMRLVVLLQLIKENVVFWLWVSSIVHLCLKTLGQNCAIFGYFAQVRTFGTKKCGPTKHWSILHGIGSTASTDRRECGFMIAGLFVCPFVPKMWGPKLCNFWLFCTGPDLCNQKMGSDEALIYSPWDW